MLADQQFRNASLHESVMPLGFQNAPALLEWAVGGSLASRTVPKVDAVRQRPAQAGEPDDFYIPHGLLGTCATEERPAQIEPIPAS